MNRKREYQICTRCVMDTTDPDIVFDENGYCNHCSTALENIEYYKKINKDAELKKIIEKIKRKGKNKPYDCIIGLSGGVDSSYLAVKVKEFGLRPLAVHLDNGWNTEISVSNINRLIKILKIDLYTYVLDWEEFKNLQIAFLKASTPDLEIPTDHAILAIMRKQGARYNIPLVIGSNLSTESIMPKSWSQGYQDWEYIKKINKLFGSVKLVNFPHVNIFEKIFYDKIKRQKIYCLLDYLNYNKDSAKKILIEKYGWRDYGWKHDESIYTKFYQNYILPKKYSYDKRRAHLSSLIVAGHISRDEAIKKLKEDLYDENELRELLIYIPKKLGISQKDFEDIMRKPPAKYSDFAPKYTKILLWLVDFLYKPLIIIKRIIYKLCIR